MPSSVNEIGGWFLILLGFISGLLLGLGFHREEFLGGYASLRRRMVRLGHIALIALGVLNILYVVSLPRMRLQSWELNVAAWSLLIGAITMPTVCGLTAWRTGFRRLFFIPVASLLTGVITVCRGLWAGATL